MILALHLMIALSSVGFSTYMFFAPSEKKFWVSHTLVGLTIASGMILVISTGTHILRSCVMGLAFVAASYAAIAFAKRKLAKKYISERS